MATERVGCLLRLTISYGAHFEVKKGDIGPKDIYSWNVKL